MDRTTLYREIVRLANPNVISEPIQPPKQDEITAEARELAKSLASLKSSIINLRPQYLQASGPNKLTEKQKNEMDYDIQRILQSEHHKLKSLEAREKARADYEQQVATKGLNRFFGDPVAQGKQKTLALHRQGIFICLNNLLSNCSDLFASQQKVRHNRNLRKPRVVSSGMTPPPPPAHTFEAPPLEMAPEQEQMLVLENSDVYNELTHMLDQTSQIEQSMAEISSLQSELASHLQSQTEQVDLLLDDAFKATSDIDGANVQLQQAKRRNKRASKMIIYTSVGVGVLLLTYDWIL